jgi:hypothetical protein
MTIRELIDALVANPNQRVTVKGVSKNIVGFAEFKTVNLADNGYFKVIFDDHSFLFIVPNDNLILYTDETPAAFSEIRDEEIGNKQELSFRGKEYILDNKCIPTFKGYKDFPEAVCISLNKELVHGIPKDNVVLKDIEGNEIILENSSQLYNIIQNIVNGAR